MSAREKLGSYVYEQAVNRPHEAVWWGAPLDKVLTVAEAGDVWAQRVVEHRVKCKLFALAYQDGAPS